MAYADTIARITTHATTAGAGLTNPITDVKLAFPAPRGRCVRIFYGGEAAPERIGAERTLISELIGQETVVMGFWPLSNVSEVQAAVIEAEVQAFVHALRTALLGDSQLNGNDSDLAMDYAEPGFAELAGAPYRTVEARVITDFTEYSISP